MADQHKVRLGGALFACAFGYLGLCLVGSLVFAAATNLGTAWEVSNPVSLTVGGILGIPCGATAGWRVGRYLTARFPRSVCTVGGLLAGSLAGVLPGYLVSLLAAPHRHTPEVLAFSETDLVALLLLVLGPPLGGILGAVLGFWFGSRSSAIEDPLRAAKA